MKLFMQEEDNHSSYLKKISLASFGESGNSGLKINKTLNAYSS